MKGGGFDVDGLMKKAQDMQRKMAKAQEEPERDGRANVSSSVRENRAKRVKKRASRFRRENGKKFGIRFRMKIRKKC